MSIRLGRASKQKWKVAVRWSMLRWCRCVQLGLDLWKMELVMLGQKTLIAGETDEINRASLDEEGGLNSFTFRGHQSRLWGWECFTILTSSGRTERLITPALKRNSYRLKNQRTREGAGKAPEDSPWLHPGEAPPTPLWSWAQICHRPFARVGVGGSLMPRVSVGGGKHKARFTHMLQTF